MNQTDNKIVDFSIILALPVFYSLASGKAYAEALGFSIAGGLFGMLIYHLIYRLLLVKRYNFEQSAFRRYTIGCILFAAIGIPSFINQANEDSQRQKVESAIGFAIGEALTICETSRYIKNQFCSDFFLQQKMKNSCLANLEPFIPANMNSGMNNLIHSEKYQEMISSGKEGVDKGIALAREKGTPIADRCKNLETAMNVLYTEKLLKIKLNAEKLKK